MQSSDKDKIRERLKILKVELEKDQKPIKIKSIVLETDPGLKVTVIDDNLPLIRKIDKAVKTDRLSIKQEIKNMLSNCKTLKQNCIHSEMYELASKLKSIEKLLVKAEVN